MPLVDRVAYGNVVESAAFTLVLLAAVNAIGGQRRVQASAALLAVPAFLSHWLTRLWPELLPVELSHFAAIAFVAFVIVHLLRFVVAAPKVTAEVLCAAISIFLLIAVAWAYLYAMLAGWDQTAFAFTSPNGGKSTLSGFLALYFSVQVITTITFGDILPVSDMARMTAIVEATTGVFYMAILISRLVGLYESKLPSDGQH